MLNKKGDVSDGIVFLIIIFFLAISFIAVAFINNQFKNAIETTPLNSTSASSDIIAGLNNISSSAIQNGFIFLFAFLIIGIMVSSFLVRVHPAWMFLYIAFAGLGILLAILMANTYSAFINTPALASTAAQQTSITWVMTHMVQIIIGVIVLSMIILFAKPPEGGSNPV